MGAFGAKVGDANTDCVRVIAKNRIWEDAERSYLCGLLAQLPDPADYAEIIPLWAVEALLGAWFAGTGWRVDSNHAAALRPWGLVECGGPHLTALGIGVRRALKEQMQ